MTPFRKPEPGSVLFGRYIIEEELGSGGMSVVFRARHRSLERRYAIKIMPSPDVSADVKQRRLERFEREARILSMLEHPNVPIIHDFLIHDDVAYLVMEYLTGNDLGEILDKVGPLAIHDALYVGIEIAKPLLVAHQKDVVHRDVKPSNIMGCQGVPDPGRAIIRLLDFGIARLIEVQRHAWLDAETETKLRRKLTRENMIVGTVPYAPPEAFTGDGELDPRADIWSLGVVLYECLARYPFLPHVKAPTGPQVLSAILSEKVPPLSEVRRGVPERLSETVARMMARDPNQRIATAGEVYDELWAVLSDEKARAAREGRVLKSIFRKSGLVLPPPELHRPAGWNTSSDGDGAIDLRTTVRDEARPEPGPDPAWAATEETPVPQAMIADEPARADDWIPGAVERLHRLGDKKPGSGDAVRTLTIALQARQATLRGAAATSLGKLGSEAAREALLEAVRKEPDEAVCIALFEALNRLPQVPAARGAAPVAPAIRGPRDTEVIPGSASSTAKTQPLPVRPAPQPSEPARPAAKSQEPLELPPIPASTKHPIRGRPYLGVVFGLVAGAAIVFVGLFVIPRLRAQPLVQPYVPFSSATTPASSGDPSTTPPTNASATSAPSSSSTSAPAPSVSVTSAPRAPPPMWPTTTTPSVHQLPFRVPEEPPAQPVVPSSPPTSDPASAPTEHFKPGFGSHP